MLSNVPTKIEVLNALQGLEKREAVRATHSKSGTNHVLTVDMTTLPTIMFKIYFSATASWVLGDTITIQDSAGNTICSPTIKTQNNTALPEGAFSSGATIELLCNNGGSNAALFFRTGGSGGGSEIEVGQITFQDKSADEDYLICQGQNVSGSNAPVALKQYLPVSMELIETPTSITYAPQDIISANGLLIEVGTSARLRTSPDGITWTVRYPQINSSCTIWKIVYGNGIFVAFGDSGYISTSPDGITWSSRSSPYRTNENLTQAEFGNGLFVCYSNGYVICTSSDGITWTQRTGGLSYGRLAYGNNLWILKTSSAVKSSTDGITWVDGSTGFAGAGDLKYLNGYWINKAGGGTSAANIQISTNGVNWEEVSCFTNGKSRYDMAYSSGLWVAVGGYKTIAMSTDLRTWTTVFYDSSSSFTFTKLVYHNSMWIVISNYSSTTNSHRYLDATTLPNYKVPAYIKKS